MKHCMIGIVGGLLGLVGIAHGQVSKGITLFSALDVPSGTVQDLRNYAAENLHVPVAVEALPKGIETSGSNLVQYLQGKANGGCVLGITVKPTDYGASFVTGHVALMSTAKLMPSSAGTNSAAIFQRRTRTLAMCMIGRSMGLPPCKIPFCAMAPATDEKQFDTKASNFCPPCQEQAEKALSEMGMQISPRVRKAGQRPKPTASL